MKTTSQTALDYFKDDLTAFTEKDMVDHTALELQETFFGKSIAAAVLLTQADMEKTHASLVGGPVRVTKEDGTKLEALSFPNEEKGLLIQHPDGERVLVAWNADPRSDGMTVSNVYLVSLRPEIDSALLREAEARLALGTQSADDLAPLAKSFARYAYPVDPSHRYGTPRTVNEIVEKIAAEGVEKACGRISDAWVVVISRPERNMASARGIVSGHNHRLDLVERVARTFEHGGPPAYDLIEHTALVRDGLARQMFNSASAYAFERSVIGRLGEMEEIAEIAEELALGNGTVLAYNDTDIRISAERFDDKDVLTHNNIDRNEQNVFVTVVNRKDGAPTSVDVYVAKDWSQTFADANGIDRDEPLDMVGFFSLVDYLEDDGDKMNEDQLLAELCEGRPTAGLIYTYDIAARTLEIHPLAERSGYLAYSHIMFDNDLAILRRLGDGDFKNVGGAEFQSHEPGSTDIDTIQHVKAKKYIDGLRKNTGAAPRL
ncbi:hypothetical protein OIU34_21570 [Pararhizobium sp. BT-229]|uniref:hypothetical protein n=1 Tax=Pararhizobium sp. BT-229 TaxID=2986923 RepID=UPI0021F7E21E|nr:hypothetical protein [Pararhizobium sp. BT-229]MCV9964483.1 hypothetical protein [Pararhizobium sp. BT-229]